MKLTYTDSRDGRVVIGFTDERGEHEIALSTVETADLIGALRTSLEEAIGSPDRISHDYPVPKETVLADELRMLADRMEARNSEKATHPSPDAQKGKLN
jgi:hypothetical protein